MARTKLQSYFLTAGCALMALFAILVHRLIYPRDQHASGYIETGSYVLGALWFVISALSLMTTFLSSLICFHISYLRASKYHTAISILLLYIMNNIINLTYGRTIKKFNKQAEDPRSAQEMFLKERMKRDAKSVYGKQHDFPNIQCLEDLRKKHPLTSYEHYAEYVQRMADGEADVLICEDLHRFGITSGTTGKGKLIPLAKSRFWGLGPTVQAICQGSIIRRIGSGSPLQKDILNYVNPQPTTTASGKLVGPTLLYTDDLKRIGSKMMGVPWEVTKITTEHEAQYLMLLFGLRDADIGKWMGPFSSQVHKSLSRLEKHWKQLVHDIRTGTVDKDLQITSEVREACMKKLSPEPERAEELKTEFEKGFDGIIRRVWPNIVYVFGINTSDYSEKLRNGYAKGVPVFSPIYACTEAEIGINLWPDQGDTFVLIPNSAIYEFIPEDKINEDQPSTLFIDEVQKGQSYELAISPLCGFYRYRFGDVIEVVDFYHNIPVVRFMYRSGQLLNLRAEKVTEISVHEAVHCIVDNLPGTKLVNWTSAESTLRLEKENNDAVDKGDQFYYIFLEIEGNADIEGLNDDIQQQFDSALQERNNYYKSYRTAGTISPPRVYLVKPGTFKELQDFVVANTSATYNQFKLPRKLKTTATLDLVMESRV